MVNFILLRFYHGCSACLNHEASGGAGSCLPVLCSVNATCWLRTSRQRRVSPSPIPEQVVLQQHLAQALARHLIVALGRGVGFAHPVQLFEGAGLVSVLFLQGHVGNGPVGRLTVGSQA